MSTETAIGSVLLVRDFLSEDELHLLRDVFDDEVKGDPNGKVELTPKDLPARRDSTILLKTLQKIRSESQSRYGRSVRLDKIWYQSTSSASPKEFPNSSPFFPHMDTARYFKGMLYLSDVTLDHGPFTSSTLDPDDFETTRVSLLRFLRKRRAGEMEFFRREFGHFREEDFKPILAPAGSLIIFDTNTPHLAGTPHDKNVRHIVRFDLSRLEWQPGLSRKLRLLKSIAETAR